MISENCSISRLSSHIHRGYLLLHSFNRLQKPPPTQQMRKKSVLMDVHLKHQTDKQEENRK